ncbi:MAG: hypothetical protein GX295_01035 [Syntrophomonadaceae bacterium]|nr:hypothetical protein [Syntrophomonadaceae bacterium]
MEHLGSPVYTGRGVIAISLVLVAFMVYVILEVIHWPWESRLQKNLVWIILTISFYLAWKSFID